jgi:hypothetical protein
MAALTAIALAGLAISAATTTTSFIQAGKQRNLQLAAEHDAEMAMKEARKKLDVNFYKQLAIAKEPYDLERQALLAAGAQSTEAGRESERGAASTAGRIQMAEQEGQGQIRSAMTKEQDALNKQVVAEDSRLRDINVQLDLETVAGAQQAAAQAAEAQQADLTQGFQGLTNMAQQGVGMLPLYMKDATARQVSKFQKQFDATNNTVGKTLGDVLVGMSLPAGYVGDIKSGNTSDWLMKQSPEYLKLLYGTVFPNIPTEATTPTTPYGVTAVKTKPWE